MKSDPAHVRWKKTSVAVGLLTALAAALAVASPTLTSGAAISLDDPASASSAADRVPSSTVPGSGLRDVVASGPPLVTSAGSNGRYFVDQYGKPVLIQGDSPWSMMTRLSPAETELWFANRERHGYNAAIVSLIGATANGAASEDGATYDGIPPFAGGDILNWNDAYWKRAHDYVKIGASHGMTVMLFPIDGWIVGHTFRPALTDQCHAYGARVAQHFRDLPNIVWMTGGDYFPNNVNADVGSETDRCMDAMRQGIRSRGDTRLFTIQLNDLKKQLSTDDPYWAPRVDWNFVYSYSPPYRDVLRAYNRAPAIPALMAESNYEGENNKGDKPTTNETLRRQILWSMTSGAAGEFAGSRDWKFDPGWQDRLDSPGVEQISTARKIVAKMPWWELVPDRALVTSGQGTFLPDDKEVDVLDNDYATAARTNDGRFAVVYIPTGRTLTIDRGKVQAGAQARWVDPTTGGSRDAGSGDSFITPGSNAAGNGDWLLVISTTPF